MRLIVAPLALLLVTGACSSGSEPAADTSTGDSEATASISAVDNSFEPADLELTGGEEVTVEFTNNGETAHTFTSEEMGFDSGTVAPGESAEVTFTVPGEDATFVCLIHEASDDMVGTIVSSS